MNRDIAWVTARQLLGKRRTLLLGLFALLPVAAAVAFRIADDQTLVVNGISPDEALRRIAAGVPRAEDLAGTIYNGFVVATLLPLAALMLGTAAFGSEVEDGTAVYLLARPISRRAIFLPKLLVAWLGSAAFVCASTLLAGLVMGLGTDAGPGLIAGFTIATALGALAYAAVFVALGVATNRAFTIGLIYVFVWEGVVTGLFEGTRVLSIRHYTLGLADVIASAPDYVFEADLGAGVAIVMLAVVTAGATVLGIRRLQRFELGETS